jgi:hypothetical protein
VVPCGVVSILETAEGKEMIEFAVELVALGVTTVTIVVSIGLGLWLVGKLFDLFD